MRCLIVIAILLVITSFIFPGTDPGLNIDQQRKKTHEQKLKRVELETSFGLSFYHKLDDLHTPSSKIDSIMEQYADNYNISLTSRGKIKTIRHLTPINISVNIRFAKNWFIKTGLEYNNGYSLS